MGETLMDKDVWRYIQHCKKDKLTAIQNAAKVKFVAVEQGDLFQVTTVANPEVSDTTIAQAELEEIVIHTTNYVKSEIINLPSAEVHRTKLKKIENEISGLFVYNKDGNTYVLMGETSHLKEAKKLIRKKIGLIPFIPKSEYPQDEEKEEEVAAAPQLPAEACRFATDEFATAVASVSVPQVPTGTRDAPAMASPTPSVIAKARRPKKKAIVDTDLDDLFEDTKQRPPQTSHASPRHTDVAQAKIKDTAHFDEEAAAAQIAQLLESDDPDAQVKINAILENDTGTGEAVPRRSVKPRTAPGWLSKCLKTARKPAPSVEIADTEDMSKEEELNKLLDSDDPDKADKIAKLIYEKEDQASSSPAPVRQEFVEELQKPLRDIEKGARDAIRELQDDPDDLASLFKDTFKALVDPFQDRRFRRIFQDDSHEQDSDVEGDEDKAVKIDHQEWLQVVEKAHPAQHRPRHTRETIKIPRQTLETDLDIDRPRPIKVQKNPVPAADPLDRPGLTVPRKTMGRTSADLEKETVYVRPKITTKLPEPLGNPAKATAAEASTPRDVHASETKVKFAEEAFADVCGVEYDLSAVDGNEEYQNWLALLEDCVITRQDFEEWNQSRINKSTIQTDDESSWSLAKKASSVKDTTEEREEDQPTDDELFVEAREYEDLEPQGKSTEESKQPAITCATLEHHSLHSDSNPTMSSETTFASEQQTTASQIPGHPLLNSPYYREEHHQAQETADSQRRDSPLRTRSSSGTGFTDETVAPLRRTPSPSPTRSPSREFRSSQNPASQRTDQWQAHEMGSSPRRDSPSHLRTGLGLTGETETPTRRTPPPDRSPPRESKPSENQASVRKEYEMVSSTSRDSPSHPTTGLGLADETVAAPSRTPDPPEERSSSRNRGQQEVEILGRSSPQTAGQGIKGNLSAERVKDSQLPGQDEDCYYEAVIDFPEMNQKFTLFFPGSAEGREVLKMVHKAHEQKLLLLMRREDGNIVWNNFTPKTAKEGRCGYPDPDYLPKAKKQLSDILHNQ